MYSKLFLNVWNNHIKLLNRYNFTSTVVPEVVLSFKQHISLYEHESSRLIIDPSCLQKMTPSDMILNKIASGFLANPTQMELYRCIANTNIPNNSNSPSNSFIQIKLPLEEDEDLKNRYIRFKPELIRVGRLLEALDFTATFVSYLHCHTEPLSRTCTMVTLCVDHLKFFRNLRGDRNIMINAYPTSCGKSTIEIRTDLLQKDEKGELKLASSALFLMVARDYNDYNKSYQIPSLIFDNESDKEKCKLRNELGKFNQEQRKTQRTHSLFKVPPSQEESKELHEIFINVKSQLTEGKDYISMKNTKKSKCILMHMQDRNIHGKIFGGYLMRESIEFAWLAAYYYAKGSHPEFEAIDDFYFINAVDIGSIVEFEATVTYAEGNFIHVKVDAIKYPKIANQDEEEIMEKCTELHITFKCEVNLKPVYPATYSEGMNYLEGKRRVAKQLQLSII